MMLCSLTFISIDNSFKFHFVSLQFIHSFVYSICCFDSVHLIDLNKKTTKMYSKILLLNFITASLMIMAIYFDITFGYEWIFIAENDPSFRKALANLESSMSDAINSTNIY